MALSNLAYKQPIGKINNDDEILKQFIRSQIILYFNDLGSYNYLVSVSSVKGDKVDCDVFYNKPGANTNKIYDCVVWKMPGITYEILPGDFGLLIKSFTSTHNVKSNTKATNLEGFIYLPLNFRIHAREYAIHFTPEDIVIETPSDDISSKNLVEFLNEVKTTFNSNVDNLDTWATAVTAACAVIPVVVPPLQQQKLTKDFKP